MDDICKILTAKCLKNFISNQTPEEKRKCMRSIKEHYGKDMAKLVMKV